MPPAPNLVTFAAPTPRYEFGGLAPDCTLEDWRAEWHRIGLWENERQWQCGDLYNRGARFIASVRVAGQRTAPTAADQERVDDEVFKLIPRIGVKIGRAHV